MLKKIRLTNFKSFVDEEVELGPLTLLVGANASGKSNFLDAIRFLHGIASNLTLAEVLNGEDRSGPDAWPGLRGRAAEVARVGASSFSIESAWTGLDPLWFKGAFDIEHRIACQTLPQPRLTEERLAGNEPGGKLSTAVGRLDNGHLEVTFEGPGGTADHRAAVKTDRSLLSQDLRIPGSSQAFDAARLYQTSLSHMLISNVIFLDLQPGRMRDYGNRTAGLGSDGGNLSGVLAELSSDPDEKRGLVDWLRDLCAPELSDLDFIEVRELGDVMAVFIEGDGRRISARSLSDGTLRFLGLLLALRTAPQGSLVLIEGIESELHPTRIRLLVEYLESVVREREIQVIATTHSPVVLQWLSDDALRNAVVFGRVPDHEGTLARGLGDLPHFAEVVAREGIDELFTTGWLELAL